MIRQPHHHRISRGSRLLGALLAVLIFAGASMAVSANLHAKAHDDSGDHEHVCLATLFASGGCDAPQQAAISCEAPAFCVAVRGLAEPAESGNLFLLGAVLEHAPPVFS